MTYLLSLVATESPEEANHTLCYYINDTSHVQVVRAMSDVICQFERAVFAREGVLFEAAPDFYLEIYSPLLNGTRSSKIDCKLLHVSKKSDFTKSLS